MNPYPSHTATPSFDPDLIGHGERRHQRIVLTAVWMACTVAMAVAIILFAASLLDWVYNPTQQLLGNDWWPQSLLFVWWLPLAAAGLLGAIVASRRLRALMASTVVEFDGCM